MEIELSVLTEQAKKERYYQDLKPQLEQIGELLKENRKRDLYNFKDQIKGLLEQDIVSRYYLEKGVTEVEFKHDSDIKRSIEVLNNPTEYKKMLNIF